jgi:non-heme chloroperoxidase
MPTVTTRDGKEILYWDCGPRDGQPIVFHDGWPLSPEDRDAQLLFFFQNGHRVVAHDRRGQGRSAQLSDGHDMDRYAADVFAVAKHLGPRNTVHIRHSAGGGEVARYAAKHGQPAGRVAKAVLVAAIPPILPRTEACPGGLPIPDPFRPSPTTPIGRPAEAEARCSWSGPQFDRTGGATVRA